MSKTPGYILVEDDNRLKGLQLSCGLEHQRHSIAAAKNGRQALELVTAERFDLMLPDIMMPE